MILSKINKFLIFLNLFLLQAYLVRFSIGSYPSNLQEILIGLSAIFFLVLIIKEKRLKTTFKNLYQKHWIITTFILLTGISLLTVPIENYLDFIRHGKFLFFALVLSLVFLETFKSKTERKKAIRIAGYGALAFGIFSLVYNLLGYNVAHDLRLLGPLDAAVYLGFYLSPFFIFFTIEALKNPKKRLNILFAILLGLLVIATRSMGSILGSFLIILYHYSL